MEGSTSISELNLSEKKEPIKMMSYDEILKDVKKEPDTQNQIENIPSVPIQQSFMQSQQYPETSRVEYQPQHSFPVYQQPSQQPQQYTQSTPNKKDSQLFNNELYNELMVLFVVYVMVHTEQFQDILKSKIPSMYADNKLTIFGILFNAIVFILVLKIFQHISKKYVN